MTPLDWAALMEPVARALLGEPSSRKGHEWRYGTKGSLAIHVAGKRRGTWYCFETGKGGGVRDLVKRERGGDAIQWLADNGFIQPDGSPRYEDRAPARQRPSAPPPAEPGDDWKATIARQIWIAATGDPAPVRAYLETRRAWGDGPLPASVRWLPREAAPPGVHLPPAAAGGAVYSFTNGLPIPHTVQVEPLTADGTRAPWDGKGGSIHRKTYGSMGQDAAFRVPSASGLATGPLHLAEGPVDALAVAYWRGAECLAAGGAARLPKLTRRLAATGRPVVIESDGDGPGRQHAEALTLALCQAGGRAHVHYWPAGTDPAGGLAVEGGKPPTRHDDERNAQWHLIG